MSGKVDQQPDWDQEIREALSEPVADPGPGFTRRTIEEAAGGKSALAGLWQRPLVAVGATVALAVMALLVLRTQPQPQTASAAGQIRRLAVEQQQLTRELEDLQRRRISAEPVVYLGGDDMVEFVYSLTDPRFTSGSVPDSNYRTANR